MATDTLYKWLKPDRTTTYQNSVWPVEVGEWTPDLKPVLCQSGWHLATFQGIGKHAKIGATLWLAEGRGGSRTQDDKIAFIVLLSTIFMCMTAGVLAMNQLRSIEPADVF